MVTREEFGQLIAEFESFRDLALEEISKLRMEVEKLQDTLNDLAKETKLSVAKKIG
jgi:regulator of replication initiation timing